MKRVFFYLAAILFSSVLFFSSCTEDGDPVDLPPTMSFLAADTLVSSNTTLTVDESFYVGLNALANIWIF